MTENIVGVSQFCKNLLDTMKKEQIIKSMLFLIIPLFAISCDGNGLMEYEETALVQGDVQQGLLMMGQVIIHVWLI